MAQAWAEAVLDRRGVDANRDALLITLQVCNDDMESARYNKMGRRVRVASEAVPLRNRTEVVKDKYSEFVSPTVGRWSQQAGAPLRVSPLIGV